MAELTFVRINDLAANSSCIGKKFGVYGVEISVFCLGFGLGM